MRHLRSILYALVLAPAVWILCGVGFTQDLTGRARDAGSVETASAILLLVLAGAAYALLLFSPISPLGPAVFGLLFLGVGLWAVIAPDSYAGAWPAAITKDGFDLSRPGYALTVLLAVPMLCTALSVRRWHGYEPPQLPLIGTVGRARGAAVVPGTSIEAERTAIITAADATEVLDLPAPAEPPTEAVPTQPVPMVEADEPTVLVTPTPSAPAEKAAADRSNDEPTVASAEATADPTADRSNDEPTVASAEATADPTAEAETEELVEESPGVDRDVVAAEEPTEPLADETVAEVADAEPEVADAEPMDGADDEPTAVDEVGPPATPYDGEPAEAGAVEAGTVTADVTGDADDGEERTQVIRLPVAQTEPGPDETTRLPETDGRTQAAPGETTQVIFWRQPADQPTPEEAARAQAAADQTARDQAAQERARQAFRDRAAQERAKEAFAERAAQDAREHGEKTQVINLAGRREQPIPGDQTQVLPGAGRTEPAGDRTQTLPDARTVEPAGDQTQVLRSAVEPAGDRTQLLPGGATVEPPGDRTQVLSFPFPRPTGPRQNPGERTTDKQEPPTRANSIVGAEQPDPGADPTTRLGLLRPAIQAPGEDTTADVGDNRRTKGLLDLERPADETADDTRRLAATPPGQPQDDEPTTRL